MKLNNKLFFLAFLFCFLGTTQMDAQWSKIIGSLGKGKTFRNWKLPKVNSTTYKTNPSNLTPNYNYPRTGSYSINYSNKRWNSNYKWNANHSWNSRSLNLKKMTVVVGRNNKVIFNSKAAVQVTRTKKPPVSNSRKREIENLVKKKSRTKNKLSPIKKDNGNQLTAIGDHTVFKRNTKGVIYKYETYKKGVKNNFTPQKRYDGGHPDGKQGKPHMNKSGEYISTPHIQGKAVKEGVRKPKPSEIPKISMENLSEKK